MPAPLFSGIFWAHVNFREVLILDNETKGWFLNHKDGRVESDKIRIMIVDNRASNRRGLKALLAFEPRIVVVSEADDGKEAVQLMGKDQPDLVLMDVHMPVMDGIKATQKIKSAWPGVKVVLYSVYPGYEKEATLAGADGFMVKGSEGVTPSEIILSFFPSSDSSRA